MDITLPMAVISSTAAISGIALGWAGRARSLRQDTKNDAGQDAYLKADVEYIKRGVDDMRVEQRLQGQRFDVLSERVTRIEESSKQANKRLDRLEAEN